MEHALELARRGTGLASPNPMVGCILVRDGQIVGEGFHQYDLRDHAEIVALKSAGEKARGSTMYVTLEPCSHHGRTGPCVDAIIAAGVARVVSALVDPNPEVAGAGHWRLAEAGVIVEVGIGAEEARRAHAGHIRRVEAGRPHVTLKLAVSADGKVARSGRRRVEITGESARSRVYLMRSRSDAVLTGIGTVLADDPILTSRLPGIPSPERVILDSTLRLPLASKLVATARQVPLWVITGQAADSARQQTLAVQGVDVLRATTTDGKLDLGNVLTLLARRGITRLMVESGPILAAAFLRGDLIDEAALFRSRRVIGRDGIEALDGLPLSALTQSLRLKAVGSESIEADTLQKFERA